MKPINRQANLAKAVVALLTLAALGWPAVDVVAQSCGFYANSCYVSTAVPCNNATCAQYMGGGPTCSDNMTPSVAFSATTTTTWYHCYTPSNPNLPTCTETSQVCANVYLFSSIPCNNDSLCGNTINNQCRATIGVSCN